MSKFSRFAAAQNVVSGVTPNTYAVCVQVPQEGEPSIVLRALEGSEGVLPAVRHVHLASVWPAWGPYVFEFPDLSEILNWRVYLWLGTGTSPEAYSYYEPSELGSNHVYAMGYGISNGACIYPDIESLVPVEYRPWVVIENGVLPAGGSRVTVSYLGLSAAGASCAMQALGRVVV